MVRKVLWMTLAAAVAVFCVVQDRVTAEGARRYVAVQKNAIAGRGPTVPINEVMDPAIARSVRLGLIASVMVLVAGGGVGFVIRRRWPDA
jgi:hypothetical protein